MRLSHPSRFLSISFLAFLFLFLNLDPELNFQTISQTKTITTITGGQTDGTEADTEISLNRSNFSQRLNSLVTEVHYLALVINNPQPSQSPYYENASPDLLDFVAQVYNGEEGRVRGVYVKDVLALPVIQQPNGEIAFVSNENNLITEFQSAAANGIIGLLAHNYLSGTLFYNLKEGMEVFIVFGNGTIRRFIVDNISQYQRLERANLRSSFVDLSDNTTLTSDQIFNNYYRGKNRVTFQTCLARDGFSNWGLQFTQARAIDATPLIPIP